MKRVLSFILALTMTLTLCACGSGSGKLSPYLMDFQFGAGEEATEKTILDLEKNDTYIYILVSGKERFKYAQQEQPQPYALCVTFYLRIRRKH